MASVFIVNSSKHKNTPKKYLIEKLSLEHFLFVLTDSPEYFNGRNFYTTYKKAESFINGLVTTKQFDKNEANNIKAILNN